MINFKIQIQDQKDRQLWISRYRNVIFGTPKIILGKFHNNQQQILINQLSKISIIKLKLLNSNQKAFTHAKNIIFACLHLSQQYGYFMINENMVFRNQKEELFIWINPNILENKVKIYVPLTTQGLKTMIKSIVCFLRMWLKFDYKMVEQVSNFQELIQKVVVLQQQLVSKSFDPFLFSNQQKLRGRRSINEPIQNQMNNHLRVPSHRGQFLINRRPSQNQSTKNWVQLNSKITSSMTSNYSSHLKMNCLNKSKDTDQEKNRTTLVSQNFQEQKGDNYFQTMPHFGKQLSPINKLSSSTDQNYFPNRTTVAKKYTIQQMIKKFDFESNQQIKNNLIVDEQTFKESQKLRKRQMIRQSYDKIDKNFKDLFYSTILNEESIDFFINQVKEELQQIFSN